MAGLRIEDHPVLQAVLVIARFHNRIGEQFFVAAGKVLRGIRLAGSVLGRDLRESDSRPGKPDIRISRAHGRIARDDSVEVGGIALRHHHYAAR
jgi:hypothetical protein